MFILVFMLAIFCAIYNLFSLNNNVQKFQMMETQIKEHTLGEKIMKNTRILYSLCSILGAVFLLIGLVATTRAGSEIALSAGQTVYARKRVSGQAC
jgi:formate/nitrite transporter FocA (FNT family)